jgi:hypothetical protein
LADMFREAHLALGEDIFIKQKNPRPDLTSSLMRAHRLAALAPIAATCNTTTTARHRLQHHHHCPPLHLRRTSSLGEPRLVDLPHHHHQIRVPRAPPDERHIRRRLRPRHTTLGEVEAVHGGRRLRPRRRDVEACNGRIRATAPHHEVRGEKGVARLRRWEGGKQRHLRVEGGGGRGGGAGGSGGRMRRGHDGGGGGGGRGEAAKRGGGD